MPLDLQSERPILNPDIHFRSQFKMEAIKDSGKHGSQGMKWTFALFGFFLLCFLLYAGDLALTGLSLARLRQEFTSYLTTNPDMQELLSSPKWRPMLKEDPSTLNRLEGLASALKKSKFKKARKFLIGSTPLVAREKEIEEELKHLEKLSNELSSVENDLRFTDERRIRLHQDYTKLCQELEMILLSKTQTSAGPNSDPADVPRLAFYETGVLSGLPSIPQIPDGIPDKNSLRAKLSEILGKKLTSLPLSPADEQRIRQQAREIRLQEEKYLSLMARLLEGRKRLVSETEASKTRSAEIILEHLRVISAPDTPGRMKMAYHALRRLAKFAGSELPPLE